MNQNNPNEAQINGNNVAEGNNNDWVNIDDLIEQKLKFGKFQYQTLSVVGLIEFVDGAESMFIVLLISILKREWELDKFQVQSLASIFYWGLFFGAITSGFAADWLGRKYTLVYGSFLETLLVIYTAFITTYGMMFLIRFLYGFVIGVTLPIGILLMTEQSPPKVRGATTVVLQFFYTMGKIYMVMLAAIYLVSLSEGNWRMMALLMVIPCLAMFLGTIFIIDQSCRFLLINKTIGEAVEVLNKMGRENIQGFGGLTNAEQNRLLQWRNSVFQDSYSKTDRVRLLFQPHNIGVTIRIWIIMIMSMFIYSGIAILMPFIFDNDHDGGILDFFLACIGELPALIIMFFIIDNKELGRKKMLVAAFSCLLGAFFLLWLGEEKTLVVGFMIALFIGKMATLLFVPIMAEAYSSVERSIGIGVAASLGRVAGALAPFIYYSLYLYDKWSPFLLSAVCALVLLISMITFPFDKTGLSMEPDQRVSTRPSEKSKNEKAHFDETENLIEECDEINQNGKIDSNLEASQNQAVNAVPTIEGGGGGGGGGGGSGDPQIKTD